MKDKITKRRGENYGIPIIGITNSSGTWYYFQTELIKKAPNLSATKCFGALQNMWRCHLTTRNKCISFLYYAIKHNIY